MTSVTSNDGTNIAYTKSGSGPALILVDGALCYRDFGPAKPLAKLLENTFTVYIYDRRGRGESSDTKPYTLDKEIDDLEAIANIAGEPVYLFGQSSGGSLVIEAANRLGNKVSKFAVYETPYFVDDSRDPLPADFMERLAHNTGSGANGESVKMFMKLVGAPSFFVAIMPLMPMWGKLKAVAPTLSYDFAFMAPYQQGKPLQKAQWPTATQPALAMYGSKSPTWMKNAVTQVSQVLQNGQLKVVDGQNHMVKATSLAPLLINYFDATHMGKPAREAAVPVA